MDQPWAQQPNESDVWFARFTHYRLLGEKRSLLGAYNDELARSNPQKRDRAKSIPKSWSLNAKGFSWKERAEAWDVMGAIDLEDSVIEARSSHLHKRIELEDKWLAKEAILRDKAHEWVENYLYSKVVQTRTTVKSKSSDHGCETEESTVEIPQAPPQWILERFVGRRNYEKQLNTFYSLTQQLLMLEGTSEDLQKVKAIVQASLESLLLSEGAEELRVFMSKSSDRT